MERDVDTRQWDRCLPTLELKVTVVCRSDIETLLADSHSLLDYLLDLHRLQQLRTFRRELVADIMMRSGEMWDRMKKESAHDWATKREKMMLGAMNPKQVEQYARQIVDKTTLKQRVDADTIETIIAEATADQTSRIAKLTAELKEHASKQGTRKNLTQAHQDCMTQLWEVKTIAEQSKKEALTKVSDSRGVPCAPLH